MISASSAFNTAAAILNQTPVCAFEIDGYVRVFTDQPTGVDGHYPWIVAIADLSFDVSPLDGSSSLGDLTVTVLDVGQQLTADFPSNVLEGKTCRLKTGFVGMSYSDYVTLWTGKINTIPATSGEVNNAYDIVANDVRLDLKQVIYTTGDDGQPTDNDHPKTIVGNPMDIVLSVLLDYCGYTTAEVDVTKFDSYRDQLFAGATMQFTITSPPEAKAFIETQIFKPLGGYLRCTNLGQLTPQFFTPLAGTINSVMTLDKSNLVDVPEAQQADLVNSVSYRFDKVADKFTSEKIYSDAASVAKYGIQGQQIIESDGVRSGFQGFFLGNLTSQAIFARFGDKNPQFSDSSGSGGGVIAFWPACLAEDGDFVTLNHELVPDRKAGTMGINALFQVEGHVLHFDNYTVTLSLVDASEYSTFGAYRVAPDSILDWTLESTANKNKYMFISDATGKYSDATAGHPLA